MSGSHIPPGQLGNFEDKLGTRLESIKRRSALSAAQRGVVLMQTRTRAAPPANPSGVGSGGAVNTANYLRRWKAVRTGEGAAVFNSAMYAGVIELGRRKGAAMPPIEQIARWAQRRLGMKYDDAKKIAFVIARSIARRGLRGRFIMTDPTAQREMARYFLEEFTKELGLELHEVHAATT